MNKGWRQRLRGLVYKINARRIASSIAAIGSLGWIAWVFGAADWYGRIGDVGAVGMIALNALAMLIQFGIPIAVVVLVSYVFQDIWLPTITRLRSLAFWPSNQIEFIPVDTPIVQFGCNPPAKSASHVVKIGIRFNGRGAARKCRVRIASLSCIGANGKPMTPPSLLDNTHRHLSWDANECPDGKAGATLDIPADGSARNLRIGVVKAAPDDHPDFHFATAIAPDGEQLRFRGSSYVVVFTVTAEDPPLSRRIAACIYPFKIDGGVEVRTEYGYLDSGDEFLIPQRMWPKPIQNIRDYLPPEEN